MRSKRRPGWLVIITRQSGISELFSAHHSEDEAVCMMNRLFAITSGCVISVVEVPTEAGIIPVEPVPAVYAGERLSDPAPAPQVKPKPFRRKSQEEFLAETQAMEAAGFVGDTPMPDYADASS